MVTSGGDVEEVKSRIDIVEHVSDYVQLKRSGQNYKGLCPFHPEKTPSFMVHPAKQIYHCFGCGAGGDVINFTMKHEGLSFPEALELLARKAGVELKARGSGYRKGEREALRGAVGEALAFFRSELGKSKLATEYIAKRGISKDSVEGFALGYAPQGWHNLLNHLKKKRFSEDVIIKAGLASRGNRGPYDVFRARLVFPIFDMHGEAVAFGGRVFDDTQPKYLNSPDTPLFNKGETLYAMHQAKDEIRKEGFAAVVEGYMDAIMCHQNGIGNVVAPLGTALTAGHLKKLFRQSDNVVLVFDGDEAGIGAARRSLDLIMEQSMRARVMMLPEGEDPDSLLRAEGPERMRQMMKNAASPVRFMLDTSPHPKGVNDAVELIAKAGDPIMRDELIMELSDRSRIGEKAIREKLSRFRKTGTHTPRRTEERVHTEETLLLSAALAEPKVAVEISRRIALPELADPVVRGLLERIASVAEQEKVDPLGMAETEEERSLVSRLAVEPGFEEADINRVVEDCIRGIARKKMDHEIREAERAGDMKLLSELLAERRKFMQEI